MEMITDAGFCFHTKSLRPLIDPDTNSIFLLCHDGNVNYFNLYLLVFCRHNHDIKCILLGKAAKATMYYITDYITKGDLNTQAMLSLLSHAVANVNNSPNESESSLAHSKRLLHKCLSQFTCQQQIHVQQAARYLCGLNDSIPSHRTIPILSALLILYVSNATEVQSANENGPNDNDVDNDNDNESDDDVDGDDYWDREHEDISLRIVLNRDGWLCEANQVMS